MTMMSIPARIGQHLVTQPMYLRVISPAFSRSKSFATQSWDVIIAGRMLSFLTSLRLPSVNTAFKSIQHFSIDSLFCNKNDLAMAERSVIARALMEYHNKTCIRFVPRTIQPDYIVFRTTGSGY